MNLNRFTIDSRTHRDYVMNFESRIIPILGEQKITSITTNDLKQIIDGYHGRVVETLQTILKGIMNYAIANGEITYNPMQAIKFKKIKRETRRALTIEQQQSTKYCHSYNLADCFGWGKN